MTLYVGFDPTADSLHVGNLVPLLLLRRFQLAGHLPIALAGGATGMIGDPGGRSEERNLLDGGDARPQHAGHQGAALGLPRLRAGPVPGAPRRQPRLDRADRRARLPARRRQARHRQLHARQGVGAGSRVASEHGISFTEFSYMLLQANDYAWLHEHMDCELQVGGSDQWGNITAGIDLVAPAHRGRPCTG